MLNDTWYAILIASVGFGIGSLLTPIFAIRVGTKLAVAAVSVPHLMATALRFGIMRKHIDRRLLWSFGVMSAAGGLVGALLHTYADSPALTVVFGCLLAFSGVMGLTGLSQRVRFRGWMGWVAGGVSGRRRCWDSTCLATPSLPQRQRWD